MFVFFYVCVRVFFLSGVEGPLLHVENDDFTEEELAQIPFDLRMANLTPEAQRGAALRQV